MKRKKVFLVGPPFSGHLHPLLGIGRRLQTIAETAVISTPGGVADAARAGLRGHAILAEREKEVWEITEPGTDVKANPLLLYRQLKGHVALLAQLKAELDGLFEREKPDLIIADFTVPLAGISAQERGIAWWTTLPAPCVFETRDGPPVYFGGLASASAWPQEWLHAVLRLATRLFKRGMWRVFRREFTAVGFCGIYRPDGSEAVYSPERILALGISEIEFPRSYPPHFRFIGPVLYSPDEGSDVPHDGERPRVLVTIGTHLPHAKADLTRTIRKIAARQPGIAFDFTRGKVAPDADLVEGNFRECTYISYARHLPHYDVVVHHAGSGVLYQCLRAGKPSVVYPLDFDQFDNAARLVAAGLALRAYGLAQLEEKIIQALADQGLSERCRAISERVKSYDAVGFVEGMVGEL